MHRRVKGRLRVGKNIIREHIDLDDLLRPVDGVFQIAQIDQGRLVFRQRRAVIRVEQTAAQVAHACLVVGQRHGGLAQEFQRRERPQVRKTAQRDELPAGRAALQHRPQRRERLHKQARREIFRRNVAERVEHGEAIRFRQILERLDERGGKLRRDARIAGAEEGIADGLQRVDDAQSVLLRDAAVGEETLPDILAPERDGFVQQRQNRRRHGTLRRVRGQLLAVFRAAVGQHLAHDAGAAAANVALRRHQQLIEVAQQLLLVAACHIGVVFVEQAQIGADALVVLLAARLLEQQVKGRVGADGVHQADVVVKGQVAQCAERLGLGHERDVARRAHLRRVAAKVGRHAPVEQKTLEIAQLAVDQLVALLFRGRDVAELAHNHAVSLAQRVDAHGLAAVFARAAHAEVGVDQQQRLDRQIFKFQIPCGVIGRNMADRFQIAVGEPLPCIVIVQKRNAHGVLSAAGEFADVVTERGGCDERHVDRKSGLRRQLGHVHRNVAHADRVRRGVEGHDLAPDAHRFDEMRLAHGGAKTPVIG